MQFLSRIFHFDPKSLKLVNLGYLFQGPQIMKI